MFRQFREIEKDEFFVIGSDTAVGGGDLCATQFLSKTKIDIPLVYHSKKLATEMTGDILPVLEKIFDITNIKPVIAYERQNGGAFEMERLAMLNKQDKFEVFKMPTLGRTDPPDPVKYGWETNTATRPKMLSELKEAIDGQALKIYDRLTIEEMFAFVVVETSSSWKAQAEKNAHDDLVMSTAVAWQLYQMVEKPKDKAGRQRIVGWREGLGGSQVPIYSY